MKIIKLKDEKQIPKLALFFHNKWKVPLEAYIDSMIDSLAQNTGVPAWYYVENNQEIIAGLGVISNDFHKRHDLTPNICAVYVKEEYQGNGIARAMLDYTCNDLANYGILNVYLITSHKSFYERCGFEYYGMIEENDGNMIRCYHRKLI